MNTNPSPTTKAVSIHDLQPPPDTEVNQWAKYGTLASFLHIPLLFAAMGGAPTNSAAVALIFGLLGIIATIMLYQYWGKQVGWWRKNELKNLSDGKKVLVWLIAIPGIVDLLSLAIAIPILLIAGYLVGGAAVYAAKSEFPGTREYSLSHPGGGAARGKMSSGADGFLHWVGNDEVSYGTDGNISYIGDRKASYDSEGILRWVGNDEVSYKSDGRISRIGSQEVWE